MNIEDLISHGAFSSDEPVKRLIKWKNKDKSGKYVDLEFSVFVKQHYCGDMERVWGIDADKSKAAAYISQSILLGENGDQPMSYEMAFKLKPSLATLLINVINEVNDTGGDSQKN